MEPRVVTVLTGSDTGDGTGADAELAADVRELVIDRLLRSAGVRVTAAGEGRA